MTKDDAITQTDYYLRGMGLPTYSDMIASCLHCGLPKDFHKREGDMLVCHSLESRPMPL